MESSGLRRRGGHGDADADGKGDGNVDGDGKGEDGATKRNDEEYGWR